MSKLMVPPAEDELNNRSVTRPKIALPVTVSPFDRISLEMTAEPCANRTVPAGSNGITGKPVDVFAMTSVPVTAVLDVLLLPDIVPMRAMEFSPSPT